MTWTCPTCQNEYDHNGVRVVNRNHDVIKCWCPEMPHTICSNRRQSLEGRTNNHPAVKWLERAICEQGEPSNIRAEFKMVRVLSHSWPS